MRAGECGREGRGGGVGGVDGAGVGGLDDGLGLRSVGGRFCMAWHTAFGLFTVEDGWWESVYTEYFEVYPRYGNYGA